MSEKSYLFEKCVHLNGIQRGGTHALAQWVSSLYPECLFMNDRGRDFIREGLQNVWYYKNGIESGRYPGFKTAMSEHQAPCLLLCYESNPASAMSDILRGPGYADAKKLLLSWYPKDEFCESQKVAIVLRDPYNSFASLLKFFHRPDQADLKKRIIASWIGIAREMLGETEYLRGLRPIFINYNRWFQDSLYRRYLAEAFESTLSDGVMHRVAPFGSGSSFDGLDLDHKASRMDVLNRWEKMKDDEEYRRTFQDHPETVGYAKKLFGYDGPPWE